MSWDLLLLPLSEELSSVDELPDDYRPKPLGSQRSVQAVLAQMPEIDVSDPTWGQLNGPTWSIELNIGHRDPIDSIMLHVRGDGDDVLAAIFRLARALGCRVIDCSDGNFLAEGDTSGWDLFQEYRDKVIPSP